MTTYNRLYCSESCQCSDWKDNNKDRLQQLQRKAKLKTYDLTEEQYDQMNLAVSGRCQICGDSPDYSLHVDHCHKTGKTRGLLCRTCNLGIGYFKDSTELLQIAIEYLDA